MIDKGNPRVKKSYPYPTSKVLPLGRVQGVPGVRQGCTGVRGYRGYGLPPLTPKYATGTLFRAHFATKAT